jgi:hypothetical protein
MFARLAALILLALHVSAAEYTLYHRYAGNDYAPRGVVTVNGGSAKFEPSESSAQSATADTPWYQVALRVDGEYITASSPSVS